MEIADFELRQECSTVVILNGNNALYNSTPVSVKRRTLYLALILVP